MPMTAAPTAAPLSMTAFASVRGQGSGPIAAFSWVWELRSVNGKGLDLRLRLPDGVEGLEPAVRAELTRRIGRGNVSVGLRLMRASGADALRVNPQALAAALEALARVQAAAGRFGVELAAPSPAEVLALRGVTETAAPDDTDAPALLAALLADLGVALDDFDSMRRAEGAALAQVLAGQIDRIAALVAEARAAAEARRPRVAETLREALARVAEVPEADPARVAQELALLAVKADVTEELDRLTAHVAAARALLAQGGPVGRKLDFLSQEFNREANTLCSKSGDIALTRIGLDLKHLIDQMREQVQNLE
jgi:uncharacterized protein (TIGR00255 family)